MSDRNAILFHLPQRRNPIRSIDNFRDKVVEKIVAHADDSGHINRFISVAVRTLTNRNVNAHLVVRFIEKLMIDLEQIKTLNDDPALHARMNEALYVCSLSKRQLCGAFNA